MARNGKSNLRSRGRARTRRTNESWFARVPKFVVLLVAVLVFALLTTGAVITTIAHKLDDELPEIPIIGSVINAVNANTESVGLAGPVGDMVESAAEQHGALAVYQVNGDGTVESSTVDFTPRLPDGRVIKVDARARIATTELTTSFATSLNTFASSTPGQAMFAGLEHITNLQRSAPVVLVAGLWDVGDPLDFRALAFEQGPSDIAQQLKDEHELPNLAGAHITFVVRPPAGAQPQPRQDQVDYAVEVWRAVLTVSGAASVEFSFPNGTRPRVTTPAAAVPIPAPLDTPITPFTTPTGMTCTVDSSSYFEADTAVLLDRTATRLALDGCVAGITPGAHVRVDGYTSGTDPTNEFAVALSTERAQLVAELLVELGVPIDDIAVVGHGNNDQPHPENPTSPRNRVVVVTSTNK